MKPVNSETEFGNETSLRAATPFDCDAIYDWQSAEGTRQYFRNTSVPSLEEHRRWYAVRLAQSNPMMWVIQRSGIATGVIRLDKQSEEGNTAYEISIVIAPEARNSGIGNIALQLVCTTNPDLHLIAEISPENAASIKAFQRAGFHKMANQHRKWEHGPSQ